MFQFLIGRLKSYRRFPLVYAPYRVSIPHR